MSTELTKEELEGAAGLELDPSEWVTIEQRAIEQFAEATGDRQWIHVDPERAAQGPFGTTVAHGYLSLSLLPMLLGSVLSVTDGAWASTTGSRRCASRRRCPSGSRVRLKARIASAERRGEGVLYHVAVEVEIEGAEKPALVGEVVYLVF